MLWYWLSIVLVPESGLRPEEPNSHIYMMGIQDVGTASYLLYSSWIPQTTSPTGVACQYGGDSQPNKGESVANTVISVKCKEGK